MGATLIEQWDPSKILQPVQRPEDARQDAIKFAASQTFKMGDIIAIKASDGLGYPYAAGGSGGLGVGVALSMYDFVTDANGLCYMGQTTAAANVRIGPSQTMAAWISGIFDPTDIKIGGTTTDAAGMITAFTLARKLHNGFVKVL